MFVYYLLFTSSLKIFVPGGGGGFDMRFFSKISAKLMALLGLLFFYHAPHIFLLYHAPLVRFTNLSKSINPLGFSPTIQGGWERLCFFL